jgi:hypothetical protein
VTNQPPNTGPSAGASTVGRMSTVDAFARSIGGNARNSIAVPTGTSIPPPTPCKTRKPTNSPKLFAWPQSADAPVNIASANRNTRRVPRRSPSHPDAGIHSASDSR